MTIIYVLMIFVRMKVDGSDLVCDSSYFDSEVVRSFYRLRCRRCSVVFIYGF